MVTRYVIELLISWDSYYGSQLSPAFHGGTQPKRANIRSTLVRYGNSLSADHQPSTGWLIKAEDSGSRSDHAKGTAVEYPGQRSSQPASNGAAKSLAALGPARHAAAEVVTVPILSLRPGDSPRLKGEDKAHIAQLAETETPLPPILVDRRTMRVIDGMHRLLAASLQGWETIDVIFFDDSADDIFLRAVQENVAHGLPLSQADRRAAAERIIASHPHMSDRAIGQAAGLAAKTVSALRKRSSEDVPQLSARVGRDGKIRPLDSSEGRQRAAELLIQQPTASLRDVARAAGISPATVLDVRKRLARGEPPAREGSKSPGGAASSGDSPMGAAATVIRAHADSDHTSVSAAAPGPQPASPSAGQNPAATVEKLLRDPSLRNNEWGKGMLRLLHINAVGTEQLPDVAAAVPPHCVTTLVGLARHYAKMWQDFAGELDERAQIIDPSAATH